MAEFPQDRRIRQIAPGYGEDVSLSRWSLLAAALFFAAFFGLLSGVVRDGQFSRAIQASEKGAETPHLSKREPIRALASTDRKDSSGAQAADFGGALLPVTLQTGFPAAAPAVLSGLSSAGHVSSFWPAPLPRAPPLEA